MPADGRYAERSPHGRAAAQSLRLREPRVRRVLLGGHELDLFELHLERLHRLLDDVAVAVAVLLDLGVRYAHEECGAIGVAEARRLQAGVEGVAGDFLLEGPEDSEPRGSVRRRAWVRMTLHFLAQGRHRSARLAKKREQMRQNAWRGARRVCRGSLVCSELAPER